MGLATPTFRHTQTPSSVAVITQGSYDVWKSMEFDFSHLVTINMKKEKKEYGKLLIFDATGLTHCMAWIKQRIQIRLRSVGCRLA